MEKWIAIRKGDSKWQRDVSDHEPSIYVTPIGHRVFNLPIILIDKTLKSVLYWLEQIVLVGNASFRIVSNAEFQVAA